MIFDKVSPSESLNFDVKSVTLKVYELSSFIDVVLQDAVAVGALFVALTVILLVSFTYLSSEDTFVVVNKDGAVRTSPLFPYSIKDQYI